MYVQVCLEGPVLVFSPAQPSHRTLAKLHNGNTRVFTEQKGPPLRRVILPTSWKKRRTAYALRCGILVVPSYAHIPYRSTCTVCIDHVFCAVLLVGGFRAARHAQS